MDKYTTGLKIQEIKKMYKSEEIAGAVKLAREIDWTKIKDWSSLAMMTDIYEKAGDYKNARDMAILAYNRNLGGRKLVYRLGDLLIKSGDLDDAEDIYEEYCNMAKSSADRHLLRYHLLRAENAPDEDLIEALEEYTEDEVDERYMYRLAEMYAKNGEDDKCINVCDNISLWFKDGDFVEGAVKLKKKLGGTLSPAQETIYAASKVEEEELSKTRELSFASQINLADERENKTREGYYEDGSSESASGGGRKGGVVSMIKNVFESDEDYYEEEGEVPDVHGDDIKASDVAVAAGAGAAAVAASEAVAAATGSADENAQEEGWNFSFEDKDFVKDEAARKEMERSGEDIETLLEEESEVKKAQGSDAVAQRSSDESGNSGLSSKSMDMINSARQKIEERRNRGKDEKGHSIDPEVQQSLTAGVSEIMIEESALRGEGVIKNGEDIDGQVNMGEWMDEMRSIKYSGQDTKEYSKPELDRLLAEKDEKSQAFDRLMAEQRRLADEAGKPFNEALAKRKVEEQMVIGAARTDLNIRTGKAAARIESSETKASVSEDRSEQILKEVLYAADRQAQTGGQGTPSVLLENIERAVVSSMYAGNREAIVGGKDIPAEVINAAVLLVDYIGGKYNPSAAQAASGAAKKAPEPAEKPVDVQSAEAAEKAAGKEPSSVAGQVAAGTVAAGAVAAGAVAAGSGDTRPIPKVEAKPAPKAEVKAETKPEAKPAPKSEVKAETKPEAKPAPKAEVKAETKPEAKAESKPEAKPAPKAEQKPEEKQEPKVSATVKPELTPEKRAERSDRSVEEAKKTEESTGEKPDLTFEDRAKEAAKPEPKAETKPEQKEEAKPVSAPDPEPEKKVSSKTGEVPDLSKIKMNQVTPEVVAATLQDDEAALAERITSEDRAVDVITARITAPISTKDVEAALAASAADEIKIQDPDVNDTAHIDKQMLREIIEAAPDEQSDTEGATRRFDTTAKHDTAQLEKVLSADLSKGRKAKIMSLFDEYYDLPEIDEQVERYIASLPADISLDDSSRGNITITGQPSTDKTGLAKTLAKAVNLCYPKQKRKIIKTTGANLNAHGFIKNVGKLRGTVLIVEEAGNISPDILSEMITGLKGDTGRMIVMLTDTDAGIDTLKKTNREFDRIFNHKFSMRPYVTNELVQIAGEFASQAGYTIDEEGSLALFLKADEMRNTSARVTMDDMADVIDSAIARAKKRLKKAGRKGTDARQNVLTEEDFK